MARVQAPQPAAADTVHDTEGAAAAGPLPLLGLVAGGTTNCVSPKVAMDEEVAQANRHYPSEADLRRKSRQDLEQKLV